MRETLPGSVAAALERYLSLMDAHAGGMVLGFYLVGSVALDDYQDGRSDIDFIALLKQPIDDAAFVALARVHAAMSGAKPNFDGLYVDTQMLASLPSTPSIVPRSLDGAFEVRACFETNPAVWLCLARHGVRVRGPDPGSLTIAHDPHHLRAFLVGNLETYWRDGSPNAVRRSPASGLARMAAPWRWSGACSASLGSPAPWRRTA